MRNTEQGRCAVPMQNQIEDVLAEEILSGRVHRGDTVHVGLKKGKIVFGSETEKTAR